MNGHKVTVVEKRDAIRARAHAKAAQKPLTQRERRTLDRLQIKWAKKTLTTEEKSYALALSARAWRADTALERRQDECNPILTSHINPPVPSRQYDWEAIRRDYDEGDPIGRGPTEQAAIDDLLGQEEL